MSIHCEYCHIPIEDYKPLLKNNKIKNECKIVFGIWEEICEIAEEEFIEYETIKSKCLKFILKNINENNNAELIFEEVFEQVREMMYEEESKFKVSREYV